MLAAGGPLPIPARLAYMRVLSIDPACRYAMAGVGLTYLMTGELTPALRYMDEAGTDTYLGWYLVARAQMCMNDLASAVTSIDAAARAVPATLPWAGPIRERCVQYVAAATIITNVKAKPASSVTDADVSAVTGMLEGGVMLASVPIMRDAVLNAASPTTLAAKYQPKVLACLPEILGGTNTMAVPPRMLGPLHASACEAAATICWVAESTATALSVLAAAKRLLPPCAPIDALHTRISTADTHHRAGNAAFREGQSDVALVEYHAAVEAFRGPGAPRMVEANLWSNIAAAHFNLRNYADCAAAARSALAAEPNHEKARLRAARALIASSHLDEGIEYLTAVVNGASYHAALDCRHRAALISTHSHTTFTHTRNVQL